MNLQAQTLLGGAPPNALSEYQPLGAQGAAFRRECARGAGPVTLGRQSRVHVVRMYVESRLNAFKSK